MCLVEKDQKWMEHALELADRSRQEGEVPVGAVLIKDDQIIGEGWNQPIAKHDASAHAEIMAIRAAGLNENNYRLPNTTLYVTLEPCTMCAGAIIHARVERVVYGAPDPRTGSAGSATNIFSGDYHNHKVQVEGGVLRNECGQILKDFFRERRKK
ncbi:tRNA-specific adenosine deaminase [Nymphon striatum]|nr:tRNA-specific adenosine deaminase [Nymphon striatum]